MSKKQLTVAVLEIIALDRQTGENCFFEPVIRAAA